MKLISAYGRQHRQLVNYIDELLGESQHSGRLSTTHSADAGGRSRHVNLFERHRIDLLQPQDDQGLSRGRRAFE
jgi:hypothetical protein